MPSSLLTMTASHSATKVEKDPSLPSSSPENDMRSDNAPPVLARNAVEDSHSEQTEQYYIEGVPSWLAAAPSADDTLRMRNNRRDPPSAPSVLDIFDEKRNAVALKPVDGLPRPPLPDLKEDQSPPMPVVSGSAMAAQPPPPSPPRPPTLHTRNVSWDVNIAVQQPAPKTSSFYPQRRSSNDSQPSSVSSGHPPHVSDATGSRKEDGSVSDSSCAYSTGSDDAEMLLGKEGEPYEIRKKSSLESHSSGRIPVAYGSTPHVHKKHHRHTSRVPLLIDDLTGYNPVEAEAETYLLRALEHRAPSTNKLASTHPTKPVVLPQLDDHVVTRLAERVMDNTEAHKSPVSSINSIPSGESRKSVYQNSPTQSQPPDTRLPNTTNTFTKIDNTPSLNRRNEPKSKVNPSKNIPRPNLHRNVTMEQKLRDLASAMDAMNAGDDRKKPGNTNAHRPRINTAESYADDRAAHSRDNTMDALVGLEMANHSEHVEDVSSSSSRRAKTVPVTNVEAFHQNARIMNRRIKKNNEELINSNHTAAESDNAAVNKEKNDTIVNPNASNVNSIHWDKLKARFRLFPIHPKKQEDQSLQSDEEKRNKTEVSFGDTCYDDLVKSTATIDKSQQMDSDIPTSSVSSENAGSSETDSNEPPFRSTLLGEDWKISRDIKNFIEPRKYMIRLFSKTLLGFVMIPATCIAAILFYFVGNPPTGVLINDGFPINGTLVNTNGNPVEGNVASASWWLLFACVRQPVTLSFAWLIQIIIVDYLSIHRGVTFHFFGALPTLFILQSRGWPFVSFAWGTLNMILLRGSKPFFAHWLYWQKLIGLMNMRNPSGIVVDSDWNQRILTIMIGVSFVTTLKRFFLGFYLGKNAFRTFSIKLAIVAEKILLISQVADLSKEIEHNERRKVRSIKHRSFLAPVLTQDKLGNLLENVDSQSTSTVPIEDRVSSPNLGFNSSLTGAVIDPDDRHPLTGVLSQSQRNRITQLLGAWEEPMVTSEANDIVSVSALLQFRRALACLNTDFPFSASFGPAGTRDVAIESSQTVFRRLLKGSDSDEDVLSFDTLAALGVLPDGSLDHEQLIALIKLFRPNRDGTLTMIDFVKSTDSVYREIRLLRAAVTNSSKIDAAFENILNIIFYVVVTMVILSLIGLDPLAMFLSISGIIIAFAFMIGPASSKYFEGLLFILVRRPYDIGDGIHVSDINCDAVPSGSGWWLVEDVNLFTTTVIFLFTNERATVSNGSLANSRIINATRSHHAIVCNYIKLPLDVSYDKIEIFRQAIEQYVHNRPREWRSLCSFRAINIEMAQGFVEYTICLEHRESWKNWAALRNSQAHLATFCVELCKKLDIWYESPPVPVNLTFMNGPPNAVTSNLMGPSSVQLDRSSNVARMSRSSNNHVRMESSLSINSVSSAGGAAYFDYSPELRSLQERFAPSNDPTR